MSKGIPSNIYFFDVLLLEIQFLTWDGLDAFVCGWKVFGTRTWQISGTLSPLDPCTRLFEVFSSLIGQRSISLSLLAYILLQVTKYCDIILQNADHLLLNFCIGQVSLYYGHADISMSSLAL